MPVTVKIQDKSKQKPVENVVPAPNLADYAAPDERSEGMKVFWLWFIPMLLASVALLALPALFMVGIIIFAWWVLSSLGYFIIGPRMVLRRLRMHGDEFVISARSQPRLNALISKGSALLEIPAPETYLVDEGFLQIRLIKTGPTSLLISKATAELLEPQELDCLVFRALIHIRQKHARRLMVMQLLSDTPPSARILAWPIAIYAYLLRASWSELADQTADRLTLLLIKNDKLLMGAMLKQYAASDPIMMENNISSTDVDNFISQAGVIDTTGSSISTQYKIGSSIQANPYLEERINALRAWSRSTEYREAVKKMSDSRAKTEPAKA